MILYRICKLTNQRAFSLWLRYPFIYYFSENKRKRDYVLNYLHGETRRVIKLRRNLLAKIDIKNNIGFVLKFVFFFCFYL